MRGGKPAQCREVCHEWHLGVTEGLKQESDRARFAFGRKFSLQQGMVVEGTHRAIWKEKEAPLSTPGRLAGPPAAHSRFCGNPPPLPFIQAENPLGAGRPLLPGGEREGSMC